ncbi:MAG TPA: hypothetical protein PKA05_12945 [Roseiflexaceae bacterium]|nr:hypothetical protein [Roseiflexaceae bacterium]HMP41283.1 hypothetical protein [Roseiflexaceae bacterium]
MTIHTTIRLRVSLLLLVLTLIQPLFPGFHGTIDRARTAAAGTGYIRPEFAVLMGELRPLILAAAARHNRPGLSQMSDTEFAATIALVMYNEHVGWLEDSIPQLRSLTPAYQRAQIGFNLLFGTDLTVWPSNLRPSVAEEIIRTELPVPAPVNMIHAPIRLAGQIDMLQLPGDQQARYRMLTAAVIRPAAAIEYLAANLERGILRAEYEEVAVTWRTLAAWHNQGIVTPAAIAANPAVRHYLQRAEHYLPAARMLVATRERSHTALRSQAMPHPTDRLCPAIHRRLLHAGSRHPYPSGRSSGQERRGVALHADHAAIYRQKVVQ